MKSILKNTWTILEKKERARFMRLIALDIVISIVDILSLALLLWIIQFYIDPGASRYVNLLPSWLADKNSVWFIAVFFIVVTGSKSQG